jgi:hypothetical protein
MIRDRGIQIRSRPERRAEPMETETQDGDETIQSQPKMNDEVREAQVAV